MTTVLAPIAASADLTVCEPTSGHTKSVVGKVILLIEAARLLPSDVPTSPVPSFPVLAAPAEFGLPVPTLHLEQTLQTVAEREALIESPSMPELPVQYTARYDSPQAIYARYVAARDAWYREQPADSIKTNQQYRKAVGLPPRYDKQSYAWCLDYKQMSKRCITATGSREWTKEETMAYLDWSKAEDERVEAVVVEELRDNPLASRRRGMKDIWRSTERDSKKQQALHSRTGKIGECIIVKP